MIKKLPLDFVCCSILVILIIIFFGKNIFNPDGSFMGGVDIIGYSYWTEGFTKEMLLSGTHRYRFVRQPPDAETADFEHAGQRRGRTHQQAAGAGLDIGGSSATSRAKAARLVRPIVAAPRSNEICRSRPVRGPAQLSVRRGRPRRGWLLRRPPSRRRQAHHEAGAEYARSTV